MSQTEKVASSSPLALRYNKWLALATVSTISGMLIGGLFVSISVYIPSLQQSEGWNATGLGGAVTAMLFSSSLAGIFAGALVVDRIGSQATIIVGALIGALGCALASHVHSVEPFVGALLVIGVGVGVAGPVSSIPVSVVECFETVGCLI